MEGEFWFGQSQNLQCVLYLVLLCPLVKAKKMPLPGRGPAQAAPAQSAEQGPSPALTIRHVHSPLSVNNDSYSMPDPVKSWGRSGEQDTLGPCPHGAETSEGRHLQSKLKLGQNGLPQPDGQGGLLGGGGV